MKILGSQSSLINSVTGNGGIYGITAKPGKDSDGTIYQFNDGKEQKQSFDSNKNQKVVAGDAMDKFTLTGSGWDHQGTEQVDDQTGMHGTYYKNKDGGGILITAGHVDFQA